jgi:hypothetical protein
MHREKLKPGHYCASVHLDTHPFDTYTLLFVLVAEYAASIDCASIGY